MKIFLRTLVRRWPVFLVVIALAGGSTYAMLERVGPTYETVGSTLIFPPADEDGAGPTPAGGNPYLALGGLTQARDIVIRTLTSKTVRTEIEQTYPGMSFEATPDFTNSAPIVLFTVEAGTPEASTQALIELMGRVPATLANLQENQALTERARITSLALTEDIEPTVVRKGQIRAGILVGAGSLGIGLLFLALIDGLLVGRRRRLEALSESEAMPSVDVPAAPESTGPPGSSGGAHVRLPVLRALGRRFRSRRDESVVTTIGVASVPAGDEVPIATPHGQSRHRDSDVEVEFPLVTSYLIAMNEEAANEERAAEDTTDEDTTHHPDQIGRPDDCHPASSPGDVRVPTARAPATKVGATRLEDRLVSVVEIRRARDNSLAEAAISPSTRRQHEVRGAR